MLKYPAKLLDFTYRTSELIQAFNNLKKNIYYNIYIYIYIYIYSTTGTHGNNKTVVILTYYNRSIVILIYNISTTGTHIFLKTDYTKAGHSVRRKVGHCDHSVPKCGCIATGGFTQRGILTISQLVY